MLCHVIFSNSCSILSKAAQNYAAQIVLTFYVGFLNNDVISQNLIEAHIESSQDSMQKKKATWLYCYVV